MSKYEVFLGKAFAGSNDQECFSIRYEGSDDFSLANSVRTLSIDDDKYSLCSQDGKETLFECQYKQTKDVECILIYNEKMGGYELHPLSFNLKAARTKERPSRKPHVASILNVPPYMPQGPTSTPGVAEPILEDDDDLGDLADKLADELAGQGYDTQSGDDTSSHVLLPPGTSNASTPSIVSAHTTSVIGTAGAALNEDDASSSEEE